MSKTASANEQCAWIETIPLAWSIRTLFDIVLSVTF